MSTPQAQSSPRATWLAEEEKGSVSAIRFLVRLCNFCGRPLARLFVRVLMVYYTLFAHTARRGSRAWLEQALGRRPTLWHVYRHLTTFALVALDRVFFLQGKRELFEVTAHGTEHLKRLHAEGKGAILLGAHLGSFDAMRARGQGEGLNIHILSYQDNARKISQVLAALAPEMQRRIITLGSVQSLLHARDVLESGGMLAMLGDRTGLNQKQVQASFCGRPAPFPMGPFLLAHSLRCPVLLVFGLYRGGNRYELHCEPLTEQVKLARSTREADAQKWVERYAARLEHHALAHPYNWFNLYDFWQPAPQGPGQE